MLGFYARLQLNNHRHLLLMSATCQCTIITHGGTSQSSRVLKGGNFKSIQLFMFSTIFGWNDGMDYPGINHCFHFFSSYDSIHMGRFQANISLFSAYLDGYLSGCARGHPGLVN